MTRDELWQRIIGKNPKAATSGLNLTADGVRQLVDHVWGTAYKACMADECRRRKETTDYVESQYADLFAGKRKSR